MAQLSTLEPNCKFAVLAIHNMRVDVPFDLILQDGTRVLNRLPFMIDDHWKEWLGTMQFGNLQSANLFLVRSAIGGWPEGHLAIAGGDVDEELQSQVGGVFAMLRLFGTIEYEQAFILGGHVVDGLPTCRHFATTEAFKITRGCLPWVVREEDLRAAVDLHLTYALLQKTCANTQKWRFGRGCYAMKSAFEQHYASFRLQGFVRAIEALILPEIGKTEKQFIARCSLFAGPKSQAMEIRLALQEAYKMRSDVEHMHEWDRSLNTYAVSDRENVALWRTRQMEELASATYRKILSDKSLQLIFKEDATIDNFWKKTEDEIRAAFGNPCDISRLKIVKKYDNYWRAHFSEWPTGLSDDLLRKAKSA